jgi:predicted Zn-dependent protease
MMFYVFLGFAAYLWNEIIAVDNREAVSAPRLGSGALAGASLAVTAVVAVYAAYVSNLIPAQAARDVNYGYAYAGIDPKKSNDYFQSAVHAPFNFDLQDTAQRYSDLASSVAQSQKPDPAAAKQIIGDVVDLEKQVAESVGNDPISWQKLASDYYMQSVANQTGLDPRAEQAIKRAVALAPNRIEPELFLVQIYIAQNRLQDASAELNRLNQVVPLTAYTASSRWLEVYVNHLLGKDEQAAAKARELVVQEYQPNNFQVVGWLYDYYHQKKDSPNEVFWAERLVKWFPGEGNAYLALAQAYAENGQTSLAKNLLQQLIDSDAPNKTQAQAMLQGLK